MTSHGVRSTVRAMLVGGLLLAVSAAVAAATPVGQITQFAAPGTNIAQVRAGPDGNLWFTDRAGAIGRITTAGVITRFTAGLNPGSQPFSIAMGPDGNMWFTDAPNPAPGTTPAIGMIDPYTQVITEFSTGLSPGSLPAGIASGPDGNLWFTDRGAIGAVGSINPTTHAISEYSTGLSAAAKPQQGITAGPDGNLWFTVQPTASKAIAMIDPTTHAITQFSAGLNVGSLPGPAIAVGTDGNLWFIDNGTTQAIGTIDPTTHTIAEFPTGAGTALGRLAVGPDGNIWFADKGSVPAIATIDPATHAITRYSSGFAAGSDPSGINTGSDGNVWFTDQGTTFRGMGQAGTGGAAASVTAPSVTGTGGVNLAQTCGGDTWSSWAGQQPSRTAFGFDGYRWLLDGAAIPGATGASYTPTAAQAGHTLSCAVTATYLLIQVTVSATSPAVAVEGATQQLSDLATVVAGVGPGASLGRKVAVIQSAVTAGETTDACSELAAFRHEVAAQTGKKLGNTQAAALLARAGNIGAALGC
jgi:streptogramin lyase